MCVDCIAIYSKQFNALMVVQRAELLTVQTQSQYMEDEIYIYIYIYIYRPDPTSIVHTMEDEIYIYRPDPTSIVTVSMHNRARQYPLNEQCKEGIGIC